MMDADQCIERSEMKMRGQKMKRILMIGTGGTIASKKTEYGLTPGLTAEELLEYVPQIANVCDVDCKQICSIDSTDVTPEYWKLMAQTVEENYDDYDGFVIGHGTDTMAFTAAALSYLIQYSRKPIVITGAQKPISNDITDAKTNLLDSFIYAADYRSHGVSIVFDGKVIIGTRAKKERAKSYNAFTSINFPCPAIIQDQRVIRYMPEELFDKPVKFYHELEDSIFLLKLIPGMSPEILPYLFEHYDCIVIESFGVGGIPASLRDAFYEIMDEYIEKQGKIVVMATQVVNEGSNMTVYKVGAKVKHDFNLIEAYDMTLEAAITKLMWIMGLGVKDYKSVKQLFYTPVNKDIVFTADHIDEM